MNHLLGSLLVFSLVTAVHAEEKAVEVPAAAFAPETTTSQIEMKASTEPAKAEKLEAATTAAVVDVPAAAKAIGPVSYVQGLVNYHDKEIATLNKKIERWNEKIGATVKRKDSLQKDVQAMTQKITELQKQDPKKNKSEISRLNKEISRSQKDIKAVDSELKVQSKTLATELKEDGRESQTAMKDAYQQAIMALQQLL